MEGTAQPSPWRCCRVRRQSADYQVARSSHSGRVAALYSRLAWLYDPFTDHELPHHLRAVELAAGARGAHAGRGPNPGHAE
ncbi:MAG: hypothetical protein HY794_12170 [Desulfarculus sp.]|nr:hypothetical protein [Desulfarculus sp.]